MREIITHRVHEGDRQPLITALGEIGVGGAEQEYEIVYSGKDGLDEITHLVFVSLERPGVTNEALLAVVLDRLEGFQAGEFACEQNGLARFHLKEAMHWIQHSTRRRPERGVEGKAEK